MIAEHSLSRSQQAEHQNVSLLALHLLKRNHCRCGSIVQEHPLVLAVPHVGYVVAGTKASYVHSDCLQGVKDSESGAFQQLFEEKRFCDLPHPSSRVHSEAFDVQEQHGRPAVYWFRNFTRTADVASLALEIVNALSLEVLLQEFQHSHTRRGQFQLQAEVTRRLDEKITTGRVEAATSLAPSDAEVFCAHGCRLDAGSLRRYQEVRNRIVVLGIQSVHQKSESFADTLLAAGGKVRCPVT